MRKICAKYALKYALKYAQNMRNPNGYPISHHPGTFITKYDDTLDQKKVLIILSTLKAPF